MILVIGSGVAGLSAALAAVRAGSDVTVVTAGWLGADSSVLDDHREAGGNTPLAQGGIAAAIGRSDRAVDHLADTLAAGAGASDPAAAEVLVREGARAVSELLSSGFPADRDHAGGVALGLEAAHSRNRIVHAGGDRTGAVLHAHLATRVRKTMGERGDGSPARHGALDVLQRSAAERLLVESGVVVGAEIRDEHGRRSVVRADAVVLATGGYASLYPLSSNHPDARGSGILLGARAGAVVADLEFVQFHPTVLVEAGRFGDSGRSLLISEAVRGAGAVLRDARGARFMLGRHDGAELAPRDVVSLEAHRAMQRDHAAAVWLDATPVERSHGRGALRRSFPAISRALAERGIDWTREPVPIAPAAHYTMGGIASDTWGRSSAPGLFVAGEVASTGVHGANRLASNSLLEGLVFGARAGAAAARFRPRHDRWIEDGSGLASLVRGAESCTVGTESTEGPSVTDTDVRRAVGAHLGIERSADGLARAERVFQRCASDAAQLAAMIGAAAAARSESRGAHVRSDFPETDPSQARRKGYRVVFSATPASTPASTPMSTTVSTPASSRSQAGGHRAAPRLEYALSISDQGTEQRSA
ncbi:FAD-binding protein [Leucobacter sp. USCH14]|uniref:L-aspartate oxidase n=1 Tax=Leucobacter sp. USCH14 TaxID=3024838 RepID=UPI003098BA5C